MPAFRLLFVAFLISLAALPVEHAYAADPCSAYSDPSDPQAATCNSNYWGFSKLFAGNSIIVFAPELGNSNPGGYKQCHAIYNDNPSDNLFVPWQTATEWSAFLSAIQNAQSGSVMAKLSQKGCCVPMLLTHTSCTVNGVTTTLQLVPPLVLGTHAIGTPHITPYLSSPLDAPQWLGLPYTQDHQTFGITENGVAFADQGVGEWGINGEQVSTVATRDANGNTIDYQIVYNCNSDLTNPNYNDPTMIEQGYGGWIKLDGDTSGSCVPINGACASGMSSMASLPSDLSTLCAFGSIFHAGSLVTQPAGWSWQCDGTGGGGCGVGGTQQCQNAQCSAANSTAAVGQCGPDAGQNFTDPNNSPLTDSIASPALLCASGVLSTPITAGPQNNPYYQWSCGLGATADTCSATDIPPVSGQCSAQLNGGTYSAGQMSDYYQKCQSDPTNCALCSAGTATAPNNNNGQNYFWQWECLGQNGGSSIFTCGYQEANNADMVAFCNDEASFNLVTTDPNFPITNAGLLCPTNPNTHVAQTVNNLLYVANPDGSGQWTWTCSINGTTSNTCAYSYHPSLAPGQCGSAAGQYYSLASGGPSAQFCSVGTYNNDLHQYLQNWYWTCAGTAGVTQTYANCAASIPASQQAGICSEVTAACLYGTALPATCDSNNNCAWQCQGDTGTSPTSCTSAPRLPTADGACGLANGLTSFIAPNANLCSSGQASVVEGTGPWTWTCNGTGGSTVSASCSLNVCTQCSGQYTRTNSSLQNYSSGSCTATATGSWTEVDDLVSSTTPPGTVSWTDLLGNFSAEVAATSATKLSPIPGAPTFCQPCYVKLNHVTGLTDTVTKASAKCPFTNGVYAPSSTSP